MLRATAKFKARVHVQFAGALQHLEPLAEVVACR